MKRMHTALEVANYFLFQSDEEAGDVMSNLKVQKLLYYAQGLYLAANNKPLFAEDIRAWMHGPVVPQVYKKFKKYEAGGVPRPNACPNFSKEIQKFLDSIYRVYGQYSAWKLRNFTHEEAPWKNTAQGEIITHAAMKDYFVTQLA